MATLEIPVRNDSSAYRFQIVLENRLYFFEFTFNTRMGRWLMDIESESQIPLITGVVVLSAQSLLDGYTSDSLPPGFFVCVDMANLDRQPDRENFGADVKLFYRESIDV